MILLDGKATANTIKQEIKHTVENWVTNGNRAPHLAAVLVGNDGASLTYVNHKVKACEQVGFKSTLITFPEDVSEDELLDKIHQLNQDFLIDGYIIQLPLPKHINEQKVTLAIDPKKDVDGFHPQNIGKMVLNLPSYLPATPYGIIQLLERFDIETSGKNCVIIGRSHIVGSPMSILMARNATVGNATVTLTHSRTQNLSEITKRADILIVALGRPEFVTAEMVKEGVTIIDVGITRIEDDSKKSGYRLVGDVNFDDVKDKAGAITPVPGGVGPMTIVSLLKNTLIASTS